jgi:hypothetical protein
MTNRKFETDGRGGATMTLPQGADYSLTESALIPFQAEPTHPKYASFMSSIQRSIFQLAPPMPPPR